MASTNVVNLDALIRRADLAAPGELGEDINAMSIMGLEPKGLLYPALRKPDFQRETANWGPEQIADLISTFARRDLIPAVILWRAGKDVFVIDGAHRLSALIAWVHNDYGDGEVSRRFFQNSVPDEQIRAAKKARDLVNAAVGSYDDHKMAIDFPQNSRPDVVERAARIGWQEIPAQWIRNADHDKAEKSFFRINQGGTKIDPVERRILSSRRSATALAARAILRGGTGHNYWQAFDAEIRAKIEDLSREIHNLLFEPNLNLPIKTLDLPVAGQGYGPKTLPFVFDLVNLVNRVQAKDSSHKNAVDDADLAEDKNGEKTLEYLTAVRRVLWRICSVHPSSLGLHPALYFYSRGGLFQPVALLSYVSLFSDWDTDDFIKFTSVRAKFEEFIVINRGITEAVRRLGSGARSRPRIKALYRKIINSLAEGMSVAEVQSILASDPSFDFFVAAMPSGSLFDDTTFSREVKGAAYIRDALPSAPKCPTCGGMMHRNAMQVGHKRARRDGGTGDLANAFMQHPFCNSTVEN
ncbi:GmrSD restriction endonuclease domain-containing protein [Pseudaminobacter soli (ex Li et al. 2025)]|uniref:DUF262 domain-containing protein n=1 Tax=Pseudaminobacter soli (ex Li et al. 2025) TaxID=1295366 RepID=A0A2P7S9Y4_9HYPH|nr:DUF262 domain-containing protein [Mesorhizobium soli]PSJ59299.1 DUF262 domain-containing protein [Mesorhizobium soli]